MSENDIFNEVLHIAHTGFVGTLVYTGTEGVKSSATTARALAAASPFVANGIVYRGEKIDKIVKIDVITGEVLTDYGNTNNVEDGQYKSGHSAGVVMLGRTGFFTAVVCYIWCIFDLHVYNYFSSFYFFRLFHSGL